MYQNGEFTNYQSSDKTLALWYLGYLKDLKSMNYEENMIGR
ncbi:hypothetical protein [Piscirickettsia salmonis]|nr:hypothetical protein [Piscirickettsia salmonis]